MKKLLFRGTGTLLLAGCAWWFVSAAEDFSLVSPVHWGLMVPYVSLSVIPAVAGTLTGTLLLLRGRVSRSLLVAFALTVAQATAVTVLSPDIRASYENTVRETRDTLDWSKPLLDE